MPAPRRDADKGLVQALSEMAHARPVNHALGLPKYYVSAELLLRQATDYKRSGQEEQQYVMLMRYASLLLETMPRHRDFNAKDPMYVKVSKPLRDALSTAEVIKLSLQTKCIVDPKVYSRNRPADAVMLAVSNLPQINWGSGSTGFPANARVEDLLDIMTNGPGPSAPPPPVYQGQQGPGQPPPPPPPAYQPKYTARQGAEDAHRHNLFAATLPSSRDNGGPRPRAPSNPGLLSPSTSMLRYPGLEGLQQLSLQRETSAQWPAPSAGPSLGPQEFGVVGIDPDAPGRPHTCQSGHMDMQRMDSGRQAVDSVQAIQVISTGAPPAPPPPPGGIKELTKRAVMRDVHVSVALMQEFLAYARLNTQKGIESCGILAGRLSANDSCFNITTLIIPKQTGTTDTVQALNEEEIFEVQFSQELYPMGWIHTHPTQTCFLSSVDVHTQCGYQTMLDEAVAIVMAPTDRAKRCGIFRLSTPGGLQLVQKCPQRGFHSHPDTSTGQELYELCGHVYLNPRAKHSVIDLR